MPIFWISALREVWSTGIGKKSRMILFGFRFMIYGVENRGVLWPISLERKGKKWLKARSIRLY